MKFNSLLRLLVSTCLLFVLLQNSIVVFAQDYTAPSTPAGISTIITPNGLTVSWTANTESDLAGYVVTRAFEGKIVRLTDPITTSLQFTDTDILPGLTYQYALQAVDLDGNLSAFSSPQSVTFASGSFTPPAVTGLEADSSGESVTLVWEDYSGASAYNIYRSDSGSPLQLVSTATYLQNFFIDAGVTPGMTYQYIVRAVMPNGTETPDSIATSNISIDSKPYLVVDADKLSRAEIFYKQALSANHSNDFDLWRTLVHGDPVYSDLSSYESIIVHTGGMKFPSLSAKQIYAIRAYLAHGGNLLLSSPQLLKGDYKEEVNFMTGRQRIGMFAESDLGIVPPFPPPNSLRYVPVTGLTMPDYTGLDLTLLNSSLPDQERQPYYIFEVSAPSAGILEDASGSFNNNFSALIRENADPGKGRIIFWSFGLEDLDSQNSSADLIDKTLSSLGNTSIVRWSRPEQGDNNIPLNAQPAVALKKQIDPSTLAGNISLADSSGQSVSFTLDWHENGKVLTLQPSQSFAANKAYTIQSNTNLKDIHGKTIPNIDITFTSGTAPDNITPNIPPNPALDTVGTHDGIVALKLPAFTSNEISYAVFRREHVQAAWAQVNDGPVRSLYFIDDNVLEGVFYEYVIAAEDASGNRSGMSGAIQARSRDTIPPKIALNTPPINLNGYHRTRNLTIDLAGVTDDQNASITIDGTQAQISGNNWSLAGFALPQEGLNAVTIRATDRAGNVNSFDLNIMRDTSAEKPGPVSTIPTSQTAIKIEWPFSGETDLSEHRVERRAANAPGPVFTWQEIGVAPVPAMFFEDQNTGGITYCYRLKSIDTLLNESPYSDEICPTGFGASIVNQTGRSYDPDSGVDEVPATPTGQISPRQEINQVGVHYASDHTFWAYEWDGSPYRLVHFSAPSTWAYLVNLNGFGNSGTIIIRPPKGLIFDPTAFSASLTTPFSAWGTYNQTEPGYVPNTPQWDMSQTLDDLNNISFTFVSATQDEIRYTFQTGRRQIGSDANGNPIYSDLANLKALMLWDVSFRGHAVDWKNLEDPFLPMEIIVNGMPFEPSINYFLDRDPNRRASLIAPVDEHGGYVNILTGDYSFNVPLFHGNGFGLNVNATLSYSSRRAIFDWSALRRRNNEDYYSGPLGPGWRYPYGLKILPQKLKELRNGQVVGEETIGLLMIGPGGEHYYFDHKNYSAVPFVHDGTTYTESFEIRQHEKIGQIEFPLILPQVNGGWHLVETNPPVHGFTGYQFDADGNLERIVPHGGAEPLTITYNGDIQEVKDTSGRVAKFHFDGSEKIEKIEDPAGGTWILTYGGEALISITEQDTGYGWNFAYDNDHKMLTERQLPHGFTITVDYSTADTTNPERFIWGALSSVEWKDIPNTRRTIRYRTGEGTNSGFPDRVSITTPSGRNTVHYDLLADNLLNTNYFSSNARVLIFDEDENTGAIRPLGRREAWTGLRMYRVEDALGYGMQMGNQSTSATSVVFNALTFPDGIRITQPSTATSGTVHAPGQIRGESGYAEFRYLDPRTRFERLEASHPYDQATGGTSSKRTFFEYDNKYRPVRIESVHGYSTRLIYEDEPNAGQVRLEIRCVGEIPSFTTTTRDPFRWTRTYDGLGRALSETDPDGFTTHYVYDKAGRLIEQRGPGHPISTINVPIMKLSYDGDLLTSITLKNVGGDKDRKEVFVFDAKGALIEKHLPVGNNDGSVTKETFEYDSDGHMRFHRWESSAGTSVAEYIYDNRGNIIRAVGPEGGITEYDYDDGDVVEQIRQIGSGSTRVWDILDRDGFGNPLEVELPEVTQGGITARPKITYKYNNGGALQELIYSFGGDRRKTTYYYDAFKRMTRQVLEMDNGQELELAYARDDVGKLLQTKGAALTTGSSSAGPIIPQPNRTRRTVINVETDCFGRPVKYTDISGDERISINRDASGNVKNLKQPDPSQEHSSGAAAADTTAVDMQLNALGFPNDALDVFGNRTRFTHDVYGREMRLMMENGARINSTYNANGDLASATMVMPDGGQISGKITYDQAGQVTSIEGPGDKGAKQSFEYDKAGRLKKIINQDGKETSFDYNDFGELEKKTYANGKHLIYERNDLGRVTKVLGHAAGGSVQKTTVWKYDLLGRLAIQDDGYYRSESKFDKMGRVLEKKMTFVQNNLTEILKYTWGEYGNLVSVEDSDGYILLYTWDNEDNLIDIDVTAQGLDHGIQRRYDRVGNIQGWDYQQAGSSVMSTGIKRDIKGRVTELNYNTPDFNGVQADYSYDNMDRIARADYLNKDLTAHYAYDGRGFLIGEEWRQGNGNIVSTDQITYDKGGNRVKRKKNNQTTSYKYNNHGQLVTIKKDELDKLSSTLFSVTADSEFSQDFDVDWVKDGQNPDTDEVRTGWRSAATDTDHWVEMDLGVTRPVAIMDVSFPTVKGGVDKFQVEWRDPVRGLVDVVKPTFVYFGGQRDDETITTDQHTVRLVFSPPLLTQYIRITIPKGGTAWNPMTGTQDLDVMINEICIFLPKEEMITQEFDDAGLLIRSGPITYGYDAEGHLSRIQGSGIDKSWEIGPNGMIVSETDHVSGETRYFFSNGQNMFSEFVSGATGAPKPSIKHFSGLGPDTHLGFVSFDDVGQKTFQWQLREGPGSVVQVRNSNGTLIDDVMPNAWGEPVMPSIETSENPYGFAGRRKLPNGLIYHRARSYDPSSGRFLSRDPIGFTDGENPYTYAANDPVNLIDLMGFATWSQRAEAFGGVFYGAGHVLYKIGESAGTVFVGGSAKLLGADRNGYFRDVLKKHDQMSDGLGNLLGEAWADPSSILTHLTKPVDSFENAIANGDSFEAGKVMGETTLNAIIMVEGAGQWLGRTFPRAFGRTGRVSPRPRPRANVPCIKSSFPAGTMVLTPDGQVAIEDVRVGDIVVSRDDVTGELTEKRVIKTNSHKADSLLDISLLVAGEPSSLETTPDHIFWEKTKGWVSAHELEKGDHFFGLMGENLVVDSATVIQEKQLVYNLSIEGFESYFVISNNAAVWVHNITPCQRGYMFDMMTGLRSAMNNAFGNYQSFTLNEGTISIARVTFRWGKGYRTEYFAAYSGMSKLLKFKFTRSFENRLVRPRRSFLRNQKRKGKKESYIDSPNGRYPHHVEAKLLDYIVEHVNFDDIHSVALMIERAPCGASCGTRVLPSWLSGRVPTSRGTAPIVGPNGIPISTKGITTEVYFTAQPGAQQLWRWIYE